MFAAHPNKYLSTKTSYNCSDYFLNSRILRVIWSTAKANIRVAANLTPRSCGAHHDRNDEGFVADTYLIVLRYETDEK